MELTASAVKQSALNSASHRAPDKIKSTELPDATCRVQPEAIVRRLRPIIPRG